MQPKTHYAHIAYGLMEGPQHDKRMRRELEKRGFTATLSPESADLVIAHSGSYLLLPRLQDHQTLLMIDPACHNGRAPIVNFARHVFLDLRDVLFSRNWMFYVWKTALNLYYLCIQPQKSYAMYRAYVRGGRPDLLTSPSTKIVQGSDASWLDAKELKTANVQYLHTSHDECWRHPARFLNFVA
ncbi:MAG: hypothetical protein WBO35_04540 [Candidatus Saccharimonadales bacterium]